ncbi:putative F-box protein At5g62660 [Lycium ferocissimum]|uniref:putative F-box protein At5g62660 n=1 Tax=Lycium ferocissimum TaxID=112874 RepID=UPI0028169E66|nr:putative F-box protein At5g62660 [Lycium ferocissimum]
MDPLSKDYKVVWIRDYFWKEETFTRSASAVVSVYRLSTDSWRHFEDTTFLSSHIVMSYFDSYLDGFYYWKKIDAEQNCEILAFDFRNETFQVIQTPDVFNSNLGTLGLYDGCVSMFFHFVVQSKTCIEIWVMERFGFWTKRLVLESPLIVERPIGYGAKGEIFLETTSSNLTMIDPRTQEIAKCTEPLGNNGYSLQVLGYKKSLVSIKKLTSSNLTRGLEFEL